MAYLPSLPRDAKLPDVFRAFPSSAAPLLELHEALMRGPSPFSIGERELIAAYVSALNACGYCTGVHGATATAFGLEEGPLESMIDGLETAPVAANCAPCCAASRS
ncbi:MAG: carboxymuconolactone decarboxylase family protein [Rhodospirillales bacterium]|nr:carboxymuconolactone decarboxylase family protein [Rhodospirillales bacterium]MDH3792631.1 carboxymuconolactone decarboxylase family protein [Rhodospirillales bacterium]MDH3912784.1 carboxymuconolactone decarboxylase family protein [Rhodospirillales bacterium]MDH3917531.1 carboxymuconolactone decarboxylase family protein [Rhodospirillales bacterium]MDH3969131.1 carboxymuconolactone decarboxylase family protein [Rhodospirillales bacterium]